MAARDCLSAENADDSDPKLTSYIQGEFFIMKSKFNNAKRGFTIVELVIVIAIIAILAAVLIPTFSSLVQSVQMASDTSLITNLNKELAMA